jgi:hypothetical protein
VECEWELEEYQLQLHVLLLLLLLLLIEGIARISTGISISIYRPPPWVMLRTYMGIGVLCLYWVCAGVETNQSY